MVHVLSLLPVAPWGLVGVPEPDPSLRVKLTPHARREPRPEAEAERKL
jgi:hypothetical protein